MAAGDFADLQLQLARLSGRSTAADLDDDLYLAQQVINEAYLECYAPVDGHYPAWAKRPFGLRFRAPVSQTIGVTKGSKVFTGYTPATDTPGSVVKIGSNFYTYAGLNGSAQEFIEPCAEETGSITAIFYHNAFALDVSIVRVLGAPELLGFGPLSPILDRAQELAHRSAFIGDFVPAPASAAMPSGITWGWGGAGYEIGQPNFYRIDAGALLVANPYACRFMVYPVPDRISTVTLDANFLPASLAADADVPRLPAGKILELLLPIARFEWGITYKRYAGDNKQGLATKADKARRQLMNLDTPQAHRPTKIHPKYN